MITRIKKDDALLVVVDMQGRILPAMYAKEKVEENTIRLINGFKAFNAPIIATEQYPDGLGPTVDSVKEALGDASVIAKRTFSCCGEPNFIDAVKKAGKKTIVVCGIESHVCVMQTVFDLKEMGYTVYLAVDAVSSRFETNRDLAFKRMRRADIMLDSVEAILFDMLETSTAPEFKAISKIVK